METKLDKHWQHLLSRAVKDVKELLNLLELDPQTAPYPIDYAQSFSLRVTHHYISNMQKKDWFDPLLLQVIPQMHENIIVDGYTEDPVGDSQVLQEAGVLKKYHGRALLITTQACPIHCRYCFRREFPYTNQTASKQDWQSTIEYIEADTSIHEIILSGGDPLSLSDQQLSKLINKLEKIPHLKTLRFHTRYPLLLPERITTEFIKILSGSRFKVVMVMHANHSNELCEKTKEAIQLLSKASVILLNQGVLLKGINNNAEVLCKLSYRLLECGVLPYYLFQLDRVTGSAHFEVEDQSALEIHQELLDTLPGYLVPRLVREISGRSSKTAII